MRRFAVCLVFLAGCPAQTPQAKHANAAKKIERAISKSVTEASNTANTRDSYQTIVRYNPAPCQCPSFEIFTYGRWMRVLFSGEPESLAKIDAFQKSEKRKASLKTLVVVGAFSKKLIAAENNVLYPQFVLDPKP